MSHFLKEINKNKNKYRSPILIWFVSKDDCICYCMEITKFKIHIEEMPFYLVPYKGGNSFISFLYYAFVSAKVTL